MELARGSVGTAPEEGGGTNAAGPVTLGGESRALVPIALPIMTSTMLSFLMSLVDLFMVGHLGPKQLATAGLGNLYFQMLQHPVFGCATALDTALAQAWGARQLDVYARWTQTGVLLLLAASVPYTLLLAFAGPVLSSMGVESGLAASAGSFCVRLIPGVPPHLIFCALTKYLQAQSLLAPAVVIAMLANVANALANWALIHGLGFGLNGAPVATSASRWVQCLLMLAYLRWRRRALSATLPTLRVEWAALPRRAAEFLRLGAPGALMMALEASFFEASTFAASFLGVVSLGTAPATQRAGDLTACLLTGGPTAGAQVRTSCCSTS